MSDDRAMQCCVPVATKTMRVGDDISSMHIIFPALVVLCLKQAEVHTLPLVSTAARKLALLATICVATSSYICSASRGHDTRDKWRTADVLSMPSCPKSLSPHARRVMSFVTTASVLTPHASMAAQTRWVGYQLLPLSVAQKAPNGGAERPRRTGAPNARAERGRRTPAPNSQRRTGAPNASLTAFGAGLAGGRPRGGRSARYSSADNISGRKTLLYTSLPSLRSMRSM